MFAHVGKIIWTDMYTLLSQTNFTRPGMFPGINMSADINEHRVCIK